MLGVKATMTRWVADEPQPGLVEVSVEEASGRQILFIDKTAIFSRLPITASSPFPIDFVLEVLEVDRSPLPDGGTRLTVSTVPSWGLESVDGRSCFDVSEEAVISESTTD